VQVLDVQHGNKVWGHGNIWVDDAAEWSMNVGAGVERAKYAGPFGWDDQLGFSDQCLHGCIGRLYVCRLVQWLPHALRHDVHKP
jgi:hypothetical protein